ncbi:hypothetical protein AQJ11_33120 [Streptomyces corchorusii]|uniref:Uncharacterized protein n=2 Tax=Streptomyces TaxID=1883 RepID=A0A117QB66_STRCK|nr:hypothetical protein [Streptomyces corchorusii]KUN18641.1 hypothetical protein AQJ11_33120 [Streptomyces corchorusii]
MFYRMWAQLVPGHFGLVLAGQSGKMERVLDRPALASLKSGHDRRSGESEDRAQNRDVQELADSREAQAGVEHLDGGGARPMAKPDRNPFAQQLAIPFPADVDERVDAGQLATAPSSSSASSCAVAAGRGAGAIAPLPEW